MADTAQAEAPAETDPNVQLRNAANAFKTYDDTPTEAQPRDDHGRFAQAEGEEPAGEEVPEEAEGVEPGADTGEYDEAEGTAEEVDPAQPLPPSWPEARAEDWAALPASVQNFITERDAEQVRATNDKFQEIANVRKTAAAEARAEANAKRDEYMAEIERLSSIIKPVEPDPRAFGYGTPQFQQAAYSEAMAAYQQDAQAIAQLNEQHGRLQQEKSEQEAKDFADWKQGVEAEWAPKLLDSVPDLKDPIKGGPALQSMIDYAVNNGIPQDSFSPENQSAITSPELLMVWKAMKWDEAFAGKAKAKPKPSPAVQPGVSIPRSARKQAKSQQIRERLANEGSVEAGAAVFKEAFL